MISKIEKYANIILIALLPIMTYIAIKETKINISFSDPVFIFTGLFLLFRIRSLFKYKNWHYILYFVALVISIIISQMMSLKNDDLLSVSNVGMLSEIVKIMIVGGYFYIGYIFVENLKIYKAVCYTISFSSVPVAIIGIAAYTAFILDKPFFIEIFQLNGSRMLGTFEDPNLYAFYLIVVFYISLWNAKITKNRILSYCMRVIAVVSMLLIFVTMSRGGWVAFISALVTFIALNIRTFNKHSLLVVIIFILAIFIGIQIDYSILNGNITRQFLARIEASIMQGENIDRVQLTRAAIEMGNDNLLFGAGAAAFPLNSYIYLGETHRAYIRQLIPHNTLATIYAQQGIIGLLIFISLPAYILYNMLRSGFAQNKYILPMFVGLLVQSTTINVENVRFLWYLLGVMQATTEQNINPTIVNVQIAKLKNYKIVLASCITLIVILYINIARHVYINPLAYRGNIVTTSVDASGDYMLTFDIQTTADLQHVEVDIDGNTFTYSFSSAYGVVNLPIHIDKNIDISFISSDEGWMRIRNAHLIGENGKIALYRYPMIPLFIQNILERNGMLVHANEDSFVTELDITESNIMNNIEIQDVVLTTYSNLSSVMDFTFLCTEEIGETYRLELRLSFDSLTKLMPNETQRNIWSQNVGLATATWEAEGIYHGRFRRLMSADEFSLYGRFFDTEKEAHYDEIFFPITFTVEHREDHIRGLGDSNLVNILYSVTEENIFVMNSNAWIETGRYNLSPSVYNISFYAQGSMLNDEYSKIRIRDSHLNEVAIVDLDEEMKLYTIQYTSTEEQEGISFLIELINYQREDDKDRRAFIRDFINIEKAN